MAILPCKPNWVAEWRNKRSYNFNAETYCYVQRFQLEFSKISDHSEERTFCKTPGIFTEAFCTPDKADNDSRYDIMSFLAKKHITYFNLRRPNTSLEVLSGYCNIIHIRCMPLIDGSHEKKSFMSSPYGQLSTGIMNNGNFAHYFKHVVVSAYLRPEEVSILFKIFLRQIFEKHLAIKLQ